MKFRKLKMLGVALGTTALLAACGGDASNDSSKDDKKINLTYVEWDSEIASTHVVGKVLEDIGYDVTLTPLDNAIMWESVSKGEADAMVSAWLPGTHSSQFERYGDKMVHLGPNLSGAKKIGRASCRERV